MKFFSWNGMKDLFFVLVSILPTRSSRSGTVEPELALNSSPSSGGGGVELEESGGGVEREESSGGAAATGSSSESESTTPVDNPSTSLGELAIPAIISVGIYGSIPPAVHVDHRHAPLYKPLVAFIFLAVVTSLGIICARLLRRGGRGEALLIMGLSIVFSIVALCLRILLLPP